MRKHQSILIYLLTFLALSILLNLFGIINFSIIEILGYAFIFFGIGVVYISFGRNRKISLFTGTVVFLFGLLLFIISHFDFLRPSILFFPAILLIIGISIFFVSIDNPFNMPLFVVSILFILFGIFYTATTGSLTFTDFWASALNIILVYWPIIIIFGGIFLLLRKERSD